MGIQDLWIFLAGGFLLNITPGPDMMLIVARSTHHGARAGMAAALGVGTGALVHIAAATVGLSAILVTSALAFTVVKWIGALYLLYLGVMMLRSSFKDIPHAESSDARQPIAIGQIFAQGFLTNVLNPKVAIFFLAFLPQFVDANAPAKAAAFLTLGLVSTAIGTLWNLAVAWFAGAFAESQSYRRIKRWLDRTIGVLFIGVGVKLALSEHR